MSGGWDGHTVVSMKSSGLCDVISASSEDVGYIGVV